MSTRIDKKQSAMRKKPRQGRSRATVEAVIEAGARILSEQGWSGFTTNKVAEAAGVSIGSLYQYFPDKISLVGAIRQKHLDDSLTAVRKAQSERVPVTAFVEALISNIIEAHNSYPGLHRVLLDEAPGMDTHDQNKPIEAQYLSYFTSAAETYQQQKTDVANETMGLIISDAIDGVVHNAARRGMLHKSEIREELIRIISLYLTHSYLTHSGAS